MEEMKGKDQRHGNCHSCIHNTHIDTDISAVNCEIGGYVGGALAYNNCTKFKPEASKVTYFSESCGSCKHLTTINSQKRDKDGDELYVCNKMNCLAAKSTICCNSYYENKNGDTYCDSCKHRKSLDCSKKGLKITYGTKSCSEYEFVPQKTRHGSGGCYIATAVYGSYEAPQVITLRRFRDDVLATSLLGRLFVKTYYRFSPSVAERLKSAKRVNLLVQKVLDRVVKRLNQQV